MRCTSRAHGSLPPTAITCPVAGARESGRHMARRASGAGSRDHVVGTWTRSCVAWPFFPEPRPSRAAPGAVPYPPPESEERRHHAATVTNRGAPRTTMPGRLGFSIGLLMPFSLAKGIVINNAGCGTNIVTCRAFPSPRRSYQLFFPRPLHFRQKTKRVK